MNKRILISLLTLIFLLFVPAALAESTESMPAGTPVIYLNGQPVEKTTLNLSLGNTLQFTSDRPVVWKTNKTYRSAVSQSGLFTSLRPGTVTLTATDASGASAACEVRMTRLVTSLTISGPSELAAGKRGSLSVSVGPSNAAKKSVKWSSSDPSAVQVSSSGRITAQKVSGVRTAVITAAANDGSGITAQHTVTVMPAAQKVSVSHSGSPVSTLYLDLSSGQPVQLTASVSPASASQAIKWKSSSSRVKVTPDGLVTGLKAGSATITATAQDGTGKKAVVKVKVVRMAESISVTGSGSLTAGRSTKLKAAVSPSNVTSRKVIWTSSDPSAATVNKYGTVTAKKISGTRTVTITASAADGSGVSASHTLTITPAISSMQLQLGDKTLGKTLTIDIGAGPVDLNALIRPAEACQNVTWKSSSVKRAAVNADGVVTPLKTGTVTITATAQDGSGRKTAVKLSIVRMATGVKVSGGKTLTGGQTAKLTALVSPSNASKKTVTWTSSDPSVLTVNKYGRVKAARVSSARQVTVTAAAKDGGGAAGSITITVLPRASSVAVLRDGEKVQTIGIDLAGSRTLQLTAAVSPADANQAVKWTTSNKSRVTVDQSGRITGVRAGKATITARAADGSGVVCKVTVNVGYMVKKITVSGAKQITSGQTAKLNASTAPANATSKSVVWSSSNPSAASVSKKGVVTARKVAAPTQVTIKATAADGGGAVGEYTITVIPAASGVSVTRTDAPMASTLILSKDGGTAKLSASVSPASAAQSVKWSSSNENVVTVSQNGTVTARNAGRAKIYATATDGSGTRATLWVGVGDLAAMPYYIEVDYANQVVRVYERGADNSYSHLIKRMICSTGRKDYFGLDYGLYPMHGGRMIWMDGVAIYATRIEGHFLFHSVTYTNYKMDQLNADAYAKLGSPASAGCYRLLSGDAKWIHDNVPKGTFVNALRGTRSASEYGAVTKPALKSGKWDPTNPEPGNPDFDPTYSSDVTDN